MDPNNFQVVFNQKDRKAYHTKSISYNGQLTVYVMVPDNFRSLSMYMSTPRASTVDGIHDCL